MRHGSLWTAINIHNKGKPAARWGRKPRAFRRQPGYRKEVMGM